MRIDFGKLLMVFAIEFEYFEQRVTNLIRESVPGLSRELLPEWEEDLGLPELCTEPGSDEAERAQIAHSKYTVNNTGSSKQYFIDLATSLGATVTIKEFTSIGAIFRVDVNRVDRMPGSEPASERIFGSRLWSSGSTYKVIVTFESVTGNVSKENIICQMRPKFPAHVEVIFI